MITLSIGALRFMAVAAINHAAAEARMRHLTSVAGQDMVYSTKLAQAQAYLEAQAADSDATVPGYVAAEVAVVGGTAVQAAQAIIDAAQAFHDGPGPAIEQARRAGKLAVLAAGSPDDVALAEAAALQALLEV